MSIATFHSDRKSQIFLLQLNADFSFPRRSEKQDKHPKKPENINMQSDLKTVKETFQGS